MSALKFEWDDAKAASNLQKHRVSFEEARAVFSDPDLLIRTSGEVRVSNFLLWQIAYTEIWVTQKFWPDFREIDLLEAILDFQGRERRFGGLSQQSSEEPALVGVAEVSRPAEQSEFPD